jgi:hypothetical protein
MTRVICPGCIARDIQFVPVELRDVREVSLNSLTQIAGERAKAACPAHETITLVGTVP